VEIIDYNNDKYAISDDKDLIGELNDIPKNMVRWIKISGLINQQFIEKISRTFELHPLVMEDILHPFQRPKFEDYGDYVFFVTKRINIDNETESLSIEQISIILGSNYVISFEEQKSNVFDAIIERIRLAKGRVRFLGPDYLTYILIDILIDNYFLILDSIGILLEDIEDGLIYDPKPETLQKTYILKRKTIEIRKSIWPMRELINKLQREQSKLITDDLKIYLRDIYDHIFRITDILENYRDIIFGMLDMYLSSISNRMNDIMKVLTIISTVFIPLSFLAGFYGMNFQYMPELANPLSYPLLIIAMVSIFSLMLIYFKRRKWI
jgi:magnesium transporter